MRFGVMRKHDIEEGLTGSDPPKYPGLPQPHSAMSYDPTPEVSASNQ